MEELEIIDPSLEEILQRQPTQFECLWNNLPAFRIGGVARVISEQEGVVDNTVPENLITAICLFPNPEGNPSMIWAYKLGHEGNIFYPENKLLVLVSLSD